jgi:hypothetical protein
MTFLAFSCQVLGLNLLLCEVFWERRLFLITSYEFPVAFPHQEVQILNFHIWKLFLSSFSIVIWKRPFAISQGSTQCLFGVSQMILIPSLGF